MNHRPKTRSSSSGASIAAAVLASLLAGVQPARGSVAQAWVHRDRGDYRDAKLDGVALADDGSLTLSARVTQLLDTAQPNLWCLARDPKGRLYAGGGNEGKVFLIDPKGGESKVVFDAEELEVHALAFDSRGVLYVATSPRGAVYQVDESGARILVFDPEETYIWALAFDEKDRLFVATGLRGRVYRIDHVAPNAKAAVVLDGREDHIRSLAKGPGGVFYAGSDQSGILYRIPPQGPATVVYDSPMREVSALGVTGDGIYVAALAPAPRSRGGSAGQASPGGVMHIRVTADDGGGEGETSGSEEEPETPQRQREPARPQPQESYFGAVFIVSPGGYARKIWESREALPLSLVPWGENSVLIGTGNGGRVLLVDEAGDVTDFVRIDSQQVNALLPADQSPRPDLFAAASNLGQVVRISPSEAVSGTITSRSLDAGHVSSWGALTWEAEQSKGTSVVFRVRTGNTEEPDDSWSDWSPEYGGGGATTVAVERPSARYLQWQAILKASRGGQTPVLRSVKVHYLQENLPPEIGSIEVLAPGVTLASAGERSSEPAEGGAAARRSQNQPRRGYERGRRAATWKVEDANDDTMKYEVSFKAEDETLWKPLAHELEDEFLTFDATAMPDGVYRLRVTASDAPSNPPGTALTGWRISPAFDVDNTPPSLSGLEAKLRSSSAEISVTVTDSFGVVGEVAYSVDAGGWMPVLPLDRIADSSKEAYRFSTADLGPGEHTVTVRAKDRAGNTTAGKVIIRAEK